MALLPANVDYTDRDFDSIEARLRNLITSVFPDWTDFQRANFGNILREMFAFVGGVLSFYMDKHAEESRIASATQRRSLIALAKLVGFAPASPAAASVPVDFTLAAVPVNDVILQQGTIVRTADVSGAVEFQLLSDLLIPAGTNPPTVQEDVENSAFASEVFQSTALANQEFQLASVPFLDDSASVVAGDGVYTEVPTFLESGAADKHFTVSIDQNDRATIRFGNGVNGTIPQGTISVQYKTGGGLTGNVEAGTITVIDGNFVDVLGNPVTVSVGNVAAATGGANRQGRESIREEAPASLRVLNRTVAREDYEINAKEVPGVERALMLTSNESVGISENEGILSIIPTGGGLPTQVLKDAVLVQVTITFPNTLTFVVDVQDSIFLTINVGARVFVREGFSEAGVKFEIEEALAAFFALRNSDGSTNTDIDYGFNFKDADGNPSGEIALSDVFNVVRDVAGVRKIGDAIGDFTLNGVHSDLSIDVAEFPVLGTITLINGDTGAPL